jgi:hypothetical protein
MNSASSKERNKRKKVDAFDSGGDDDDYDYDDGLFILARNNCAMAMDEVDGDCDTMMMPRFKRMKKRKIVAGTPSSSEDDFMLSTLIGTRNRSSRY